MKASFVKITPEGMDPEFMVVTDGSTAHEMVREYAKDNGYPIVEHECANRFACILADLERIRRTIEAHCPIMMKQPALGEGGKPYNDELSQSFTNIEIACNEEMDDPEFAWMQPELPTYEEYTKGWSLQKKIEMYYEEDIINSPNFEEKFKEYLIEREYING